MYTFCHFDKILSVDSNSRRLINAVIDNVTEMRVGREWNVSIIDYQYELFLESGTIEEFIAMYSSDFIIPNQSFSTRIDVLVL